VSAEARTAHRNLGRPDMAAGSQSRAAQRGGTRDPAALKTRMAIVATFSLRPGRHDRLRAREAATRPAVEGEWPVVPGYEIVGVLGHGGMAVVFKALHLALQRVVALKMLKDWARAGDKELARFRAEADVIARFAASNIVQIYDVGDIAGRPYFALEYIADGSLAQHLNGAPQPARLAAPQFVEVLARAVHAAHTNGVVHRDLKPANIILVFDEPSAAHGAERARIPNALAADAAC